MGWLCELATADSQAALKSLYLAYFSRLMRFVSLYVDASAEAEEIVSDTFLVVWNNRKTLLNIVHFDSYLYTIARNKAISYFRTQRMKRVEWSETTIDLFLHTDTTPEDDLITKENIDRLNAAINALPNKCRMVFKLVREDKLKYKEVAEMLDISIKTLEAHLSTAVKKLRETLRGVHGE